MNDERMSCPMEGCTKTIKSGRDKKDCRSRIYSHLVSCHSELGIRDRMLILDEYFRDPDKVPLERFRTG